MKKRMMALFMGATLSAGIVAVGCAKKEPSADETIALTLWGSSEQQTMLGEMAEAFKRENPEKTYQITLAVVSEADAYTTLKTDVSAGADVYAFANDQLINLNRIGALARLGGNNLTEVKNNNSEESVKAATLGDGVFAYPYSGDNGYFLYYNKSVVSEKQAENLQTLLSACKAQNKKFIFDIDNSWYLGAFFFGTGCDYGVTYNSDGSEITEVSCNFNDSEKGVAAGNAILELSKHSAFLNGDDVAIKAGFADGSVAAAVTGTWNATDIQKDLGENYAAAKLPTFDVDDKTYQMGSFAGYKMYGVNPTSKHLGEAHKLAAYLSGEAAQVKRFQTFGTGPSNKKVALREEIKNNIALSALFAQNEFSRIQESVPSNYWSALEAFGTEVVSGAVAQSNLQTKLNDMVRSIKESK